MEGNSPIDISTKIKRSSSSILKQSKVFRQALKDLNPNGLQDDSSTHNKSARVSRRVSFADTYQVQEYSKDRSYWQSTTSSNEVTDTANNVVKSPVTMPPMTCQAEGKYELSSTHALLTGNIKYIPMASESTMSEADSVQDCQEIVKMEIESLSTTVVPCHGHEIYADDDFNTTQLDSSRKLECSADSSRASDNGMQMTACSGVIETSPFQVARFNFTRSDGRRLSMMTNTVLFDGSDDMEFTQVDNFTIQIESKQQDEYLDSKLIQDENIGTSKELTDYDISATQEERIFDIQSSGSGTARHVNNSKEDIGESFCIKGSPNQNEIHPEQTICDDHLVDEMEMTEVENCEISISDATSKCIKCEDIDNPLPPQNDTKSLSKSQEFGVVSYENEQQLLPLNVSQLEGNTLSIDPADNCCELQMEEDLINSPSGCLKKDDRESHSMASSSNVFSSLRMSPSSDIHNNKSNIVSEKLPNYSNLIVSPRDLEQSCTHQTCDDPADASGDSSASPLKDTSKKGISNLDHPFQDQSPAAPVAEDSHQRCGIEMIVDAPKSPIQHKLCNTKTRSPILPSKKDQSVMYPSPNFTTIMDSEPRKSLIALSAQDDSMDCRNNGSASDPPKEEVIIVSNSPPPQAVIPIREVLECVQGIAGNQDTAISLAVDRVITVEQCRTNDSLHSEDCEMLEGKQDAIEEEKDVSLVGATYHQNSCDHAKKVDKQQFPVGFLPEAWDLQDFSERIDDVSMPQCEEMCISKDNNCPAFNEKPSILINTDLKDSNVNNTHDDSNGSEPVGVGIVEEKPAGVICRSSRNIRRETVVLSKNDNQIKTEEVNGENLKVNVKDGVTSTENLEMDENKLIKTRVKSRKKGEGQTSQDGALGRRLTFLKSSKSQVAITNESSGVSQPAGTEKSLETRSMKVSNEIVASEASNDSSSATSLSPVKDVHQDTSCAQKRSKCESSSFSRDERQKIPKKRLRLAGVSGAAAVPSPKKTWLSLQARLTKLTEEITVVSCQNRTEEGTSCQELPKTSKEMTTTTTTTTTTIQDCVDHELEHAENVAPVEPTTTTITTVNTSLILPGDLKKSDEVPPETNKALPEPECAVNDSYSHLLERFGDTRNRANQLSNNVKNLSSRVVQFKSHLKDFIQVEAANIPGVNKVPSTDGSLTSGTATTKSSHKFSGYSVKEWSDNVIHLAFWQDVLHVKFTLGDRVTETSDSCESTQFQEVKYWSRYRDVKCPIARLCHELMLEAFEEADIANKCRTKLELETMLPNLSLLSTRSRWLYLDMKYASYCKLVTVNGHEFTIEFLSLQLYADFSLTFVLSPGCYPDMICPKVVFKPIMGTVSSLNIRSDDILPLLKNVDSNRFYFKNVVLAVEKWLEEKVKLLEADPFK